MGSINSLPKTYGFPTSNIKRMKRFAEEYPDLELTRARNKGDIMTMMSLLNHINHKWSNTYQCYLYLLSKKFAFL